MPEKRTVAVNVADEIKKVKQGEKSGTPYTPDFTGKNEPLSAQEETDLAAVRAAEAAKPAPKRPANLGDIWAVLKAKSVVVDADLP